MVNIVDDTEGIHITVIAGALYNDFTNYTVSGGTYYTISPTQIVVTNMPGITGTLEWLVYDLGAAMIGDFVAEWDYTTSHDHNDGLKHLMTMPCFSSTATSFTYLGILQTNCLVTYIYYNHPNPNVWTAHVRDKVTGFFQKTPGSHNSNTTYYMRLYRTTPPGAATTGGIQVYNDPGRTVLRGEAIGSLAPTLYSKISMAASCNCVDYGTISGTISNFHLTFT